MRRRLTLENDDTTYTPADLLPLCRAAGVPLVYDVHHHRCLADGVSVERTTAAAMRTWNREPLFHVSSPIAGWSGAQPRRHHDYIDASDFPDCWRRRSITVEVEAKAKELAVLRLRDELRAARRSARERAAWRRARRGASDERCEPTCGGSSATEGIAIGRSPTGRGFRLEAWQFLPLPRERVFDFFSDAFRLEELTPPWLKFSVRTPPPIHLAAGTTIDYRLRVHGIPLGWQSLISAWEPPHRFVDEQTRGPYRRWHHEHVFEAVEGGTLCRDVVDYAVLGGALVARARRAARSAHDFRLSPRQTAGVVFGRGCGFGQAVGSGERLTLKRGLRRFRRQVSGLTEACYRLELPMMQMVHFLAPPSPTRQVAWLAVSIAVCFLAAGVGAAITSLSVSDWYQTIDKPSWTPPDGVFGPVWTLLYLMMAVAAWLVWRRAGWPWSRMRLTCFAVQLALNVAWSGIFFGLRNPARRLARS